MIGSNQIRLNPATTEYLKFLNHKQIDPQSIIVPKGFKQYYFLGLEIQYHLIFDQIFKLFPFPDQFGFLFPD